jgi:chromosome segregation ATPase
MNNPQRIEEIERHINKLETEANENMTMLLGQAWKQTEILRLHRSEMSERLGRIDDRVDRLHQDMAEQLLQIKGLTEHVDKIETRIDRVEAAMATKEDLSKLETRFDKLEGRFDKLEGCFDRMEATQSEILALLKHHRPDK